MGFRAGLHLADITRNLAPVGNVDRISSSGAVPEDNSPGAGDPSSRQSSGRNLPPLIGDRGSRPERATPKGTAPFEDSGRSLDYLRLEAIEALHTYLCAASDYDLRWSMTVFNHLLGVIDNHLALRGERGTDPR